MVLGPICVLKALFPFMGGKGNDKPNDFRAYGAPVGITNSEAGTQEKDSTSTVTRNPVTNVMGITGYILENHVLGTTDDIPLQFLYQFCR